MKIERAKEMYDIRLRRERQADEFAVCLGEAPDLPGPRASFVKYEEWKSLVSGRVYKENLAVFAANDDVEKGSWGWCSLNKKEKYAIGYALEEIGAEMGEWYYCTMYYRECSKDIKDNNEIS